MIYTIIMKRVEKLMKNEEIKCVCVKERTVKLQNE